jgi:hypothetical protein
VALDFDLDEVVRRNSLRENKGLILWRAAVKSRGPVRGRAPGWAFYKYWKSTANVGAVDLSRDLLL